jgi:hypothetical protein
MNSLSADTLNTVVSAGAGAIFTALVGALGYFGKSYFDSRRRKREESRIHAASLEELNGLLRQSKDLFINQNYKARTLKQMIGNRHGSDLSAFDRGYDEGFYRLYDELTPEERELHSLIRGTSQESMHRVNEATQEWIRVNLPKVKANGYVNLAQQLEALEDHLNDWMAKYQGVLAQDPKRCLVYLADEKRQGRGFPKALEPALDEVLSKIT